MTNKITESPAMKFGNYKPDEEEPELQSDLEQSTEPSDEEIARMTEEIMMAEEAARQEAIKKAEESKYAVGILLSGEIEIIGNYTTFTLEEGARKLRAAALEVKKGIVFTPATEQAPQ